MYTWKTGKLRWRPLSFWAFQSTSWSLLLPCHHDWNHNTWRHMLLASNCTELLNNYATMASPFTSLNLSFLFYNMEIKIVLASPPHSSTLAWKIPWMEKPGGLQSMGSLRVAHDWATSLSLFTSCIGEGNGNPLLCPCLENPRDGGAWWAAIYGVAQSRTRLKWLSSSRNMCVYIYIHTHTYSLACSGFQNNSSEINIYFLKDTSTYIWGHCWSLKKANS